MDVHELIEQRRQQIFFQTGGLRPAGPPCTLPPSREALRRDLAEASA